MTDEAPKPAPAEPAAPADKADQPHALAALADMDEDAKADAKLAADLDKAKADKQSAELTEAEREKAAAAGAIMAIGFVESLSTVGMRIFKVHADTVADVKKEIADHKAKIQEHLAPVLLKYEAEPPAIVAKYKAEAMLLFHLLSLFAGIYCAIRDSKARREKEATDERPALAAGAA